MKYESRLSRCTSVDLRYCSLGLNYGYVAFFERGQNLAYWIYRRVHLFENLLGFPFTPLQALYIFIRSSFRFETHCENYRNITFIFLLYISFHEWYSSVVSLFSVMSLLLKYFDIQEYPRLDLINLYLIPRVRIIFVSLLSHVFIC